VPAVAALFEKIRGDVGAAISAGKGILNWPRPFEVSADVNPVGDRPSAIRQSQ
jgi:hypothetical protein